MTYEQKMHDQLFGDIMNKPKTVWLPDTDEENRRVEISEENGVTTFDLHNTTKLTEDDLKEIAVAGACSFIK